MSSEVLTCMTAVCAAESTHARWTHRHIACPTLSHRKKLYIRQMEVLWPIQSCTGQANTGMGRYTCTLYADTPFTHTTYSDSPLLSGDTQTGADQQTHTHTHTIRHEWFTQRARPRVRSFLISEMDSLISGNSVTRLWVVNTHMHIYSQNSHRKLFVT